MHVCSLEAEAIGQGLPLLSVIGHPLLLSLLEKPISFMFLSSLFARCFEDYLFPSSLEGSK